MCVLVSSFSIVDKVGSVVGVVFIDPDWNFSSDVSYEYTPSIRRHNAHTVCIAVTAINAMQTAVQEHKVNRRMKSQSTTELASNTTTGVQPRAWKKQRGRGNSRRGSSSLIDVTVKDEGRTSALSRPLLRRSSKSMERVDSQETDDSGLDGVTVRPTGTKFEEVRKAIIASMAEKEDIDLRRSHIHSFSIK